MASDRSNCSLPEETKSSNTERTGVNWRVVRARPSVALVESIGGGGAPSELLMMRSSPHSSSSRAARSESNSRRLASSSTTNPTRYSRSRRSSPRSCHHASTANARRILSEMTALSASSRLNCGLLANVPSLPQRLPNVWQFCCTAILQTRVRSR